MSASDDWSPGEVASPELIAALVAGDPGAVLRSLGQASLLVPAREVGPGSSSVHLGRGVGGQSLLYGFSDEEAFAAWDRHPTTSALRLSLDEAQAYLGPSGWGALVLNAAGPGACLVSTDELGRPNASPISSGGFRPVLGVPLEAAHLDARAPMRAAARDAHRSAREAIGEGLLAQAAEDLSDSVDACLALGDRLHEGAALVELAGCHAGLGDPTAARACAEAAGSVLGQLGEMDLACRCLLDAADAALAEDEPQDAQRLATTVLVLLAGTDISERLTDLWRAGALP